jgi:Flp pilus assembly protein TadG
MRRPGRVFRSDRQGGAVVLVAVTMVALVALLALGIDVGMLADARSEAQRAADSAALAGASAFLDFLAEEASDPARERAIEAATSNYIGNGTISEPEVAVRVDVDSATVTVAVRREGVPTWFARVLGRSEVPISATATAQASDAGTAQCLKPFAVPDLWEETQEDLNGNRIWDENERWRYDAGRDRYAAYSGPDGGAMETGYGSRWRDAFSDARGKRYRRDYGRRIMIKATDPRTAYVPSFFYPWVLPVDENQAECGEDRGVGNGGRGGSSGGNGRGAASYRRNICSCNASVIDLETEYLIEPGNMVGPSYQGLRTLIEADPRAHWDDRDNRVVSDYGNDSPRVITVALFDPGVITKGGRQYIRFNNFARFFIEEQASPQDPIMGRFMYYVASAGGTSSTGTRTGSLVKRIRLIR